MSANLEMIEITAPQLTDASYGKGIKEQFDNIDKNFKTLANRDFIKGRPGDSVLAESITLAVPTSISPAPWSGEWLYQKIYSVVGYSFTTAEASIKADFVKNLAGSEVIAYYEEHKLSDGTIEKNYVGIMPYVFLDGRLAVSSYYVDSEGNMSQGAELRKRPDASCVVCTEWEDGSDSEDSSDDVVVFVKIQAFPTIYFDKQVGQYCWKVNNIESGIIARGPAGVDGLNGLCPITQVYINDPDSSTRTTIGGQLYYKIQHIIVGGYWVDVNSEAAANILNQIAENNDQLCPTFAFDMTMSDSGDGHFTPIGTRNMQEYYLSYIVYSGGSYWVQCEDWQAVSTNVVFDNMKMFNIAMNYANPTGTAVNNQFNKGIFVPFVPGMNSGDTATRNGAHMFFAIPSSGTGIPYGKFVAAPVKDITKLGDGTETGTSTNPELLTDADLEVRYNQVNFPGAGGAGMTGGVSTISNKSVATVFAELYNVENGINSAPVGTEQRFAYIWKTPGVTEESGSIDKRLPVADYASDHPFKAFICPDGFLWYRDPYTYLRVELQAGGKVKIVGPANGEAPSGNIVSPTANQNVEFGANETYGQFNVSADTYWQIAPQS